MDRRNFLQVGAAMAAGVAYTAGTCCLSTPTPAQNFGWTATQDGIKRFVRDKGIKYLGEKTSSVFTGSGSGLRVLLTKYLEKELGIIVPHNQALGDCVGQAYGFATDCLAVTQIHGMGLAEKFAGKASTEVAYAGSRYEIGYLERGNSRILYADGSWGGYAVDFLLKYGMLPRGVYGDVDLTKYNPSIARLWGRTGIPDGLEPQIKRHPIRSYALVKSYNDVRDAIFANIMENAETFAEQVRLMRAEAAGKVAVTPDGTNVKFRDAADAKDRIDATVDDTGQRTAVTTDGT